MKLSELLAQLALGELSNMSFSSTGVIDTKSHPKVISAINAALRDLYTRLLLIEGEVTIESLDWKSVYYLRKQFARMSGSTETYKYLLDTPSNPFMGNVAKVLQVFNEIGQELPLNDPEQYASVFTPQFDAVQLTHPGYAQIFSVVYQALHPELAATGLTYLDQDIHVPVILEDMLKVRVAYNVIAPMGGQDQTLKAQTLQANYEGMMHEVRTANSVGEAGLSSNMKLIRRGFP